MRQRLRKLNIYNRKHRLLAIILVTLLIFLVPYIIVRDRVHKPELAQLYFSSPSSTILIGQTVPVQIRLRTLSASTNAVGMILHYNPNLVDIVSMSTDQSFCSFYAENSFDTIKGEVHLSCGTPNPGFSGDSVLVILQMRGKNLGQTALTFDPKHTMVLANDGKGTEMIHQLPKTFLTVTQSF